MLRFLLEHITTIVLDTRVLPWRLAGIQLGGTVRIWEKAWIGLMPHLELRFPKKEHAQHKDSICAICAFS